MNFKFKNLVDYHGVSRRKWKYKKTTIMLYLNKNKYLHLTYIILVKEFISSISLSLYVNIT